MQRVLAVGIAVLVAALILLAGVDRTLWLSGRVPLVNMVERIADGAPEARIGGQLLLYGGPHDIQLADLKPVGVTDGGTTFYRVKDWPPGMPGGWLYIPKSDTVSYRYSSPTRPGTER